MGSVCPEGAKDCPEIRGLISASVLPSESKPNSDRCASSSAKPHFHFLRIHLYFCPSSPSEVEVKASEALLHHFSAEIPKIPGTSPTWPQQPFSHCCTPISCLALLSPLGSVFNCTKQFFLAQMSSGWMLSSPSSQGSVAEGAGTSQQGRREARATPWAVNLRDAKSETSWWASN